VVDCRRVGGAAAGRWLTRGSTDLWTRLGSTGTPGGAGAEKDDDPLNVRLPVHPKDVLGMGDRLALPAAFAEHTWDERDDPLNRLGLGFDPSGVTFSQRLPLTRADRENPRFTRAVLKVTSESMGLEPLHRKWLVEVLGPRYNWADDIVQIASNRHSSGAENRREAFEQLAAAVRRAAELGEEFGDFVQRAPIEKDWGASQRRKRRERKGNPTRPPFTLHPVERPARPRTGPPVEQLLRAKFNRLRGRPYGEDVAEAVEATAVAAAALDMDEQPQKTALPRRTKRHAPPNKKGKGKK
jgi:hypothetical protein